MKKSKIFGTLFILLICSGFTLSSVPEIESVSSQDSNNVLLEYCTGTWCGYCPCADQSADYIIQMRPRTIVLAYHGFVGSGDPWAGYSKEIISNLGFTGYPAGVVGRKTGVISYNIWFDEVARQYDSVISKVNISITKTYNPATRELVLNATARSLAELGGIYYLNFVLTEDNLIYTQAGNPTCPADTPYVHHNVVKGMLNGGFGELLNDTEIWNQNVSYSKNLVYIIPEGFAVENCSIVVFVYKLGCTLNETSLVQQAVKSRVYNYTGINSTSSQASGYALGQNYPNPFNPSTNIKFSILKNGYVDLKFYDALGKELNSSYNGYLNAGVYNFQFNGRSLGSGVYYYRLTVNGFSETRKMLLIR